MAATISTPLKVTKSALRSSHNSQIILKKVWFFLKIKKSFIIVCVDMFKAGVQRRSSKTFPAAAAHISCLFLCGPNLPASNVSDALALPWLRFIVQKHKCFSPTLTNLSQPSGEVGRFKLAACNAVPLGPRAEAVIFPKLLLSAPPLLVS